MLEPLPTVLLAVAVVLCAWAYPKLNGWVYRRRVVRDEAWAARMAHGHRPRVEHRAADE